MNFFLFFFLFFFYTKRLAVKKNKQKKKRKSFVWIEELRDAFVRVIEFTFKDGPLFEILDSISDFMEITKTKGFYKKN